ncbi:hypothetical protein HanPI659440_Chr08g0283941 [Helianthus annuus]|nr:hypothetical protein HanPI659440_Chr08g0283941 [Helianthus annuus]
MWVAKYLGAYNIVGIPCGLWMGVICALFVQVVALIAINLSTSWTDEAWKVVNRVQTSHAIEWFQELTFTLTLSIC